MKTVSCFYKNKNKRSDFGCFMIMFIIYRTRTQPQKCGVVVDGKDGRDDASTLQHDGEADAWFT